VSDRAFIDPDAGDQQDPAVIVQASVSVHDGRPLVARWTASDTPGPVRWSVYKIVPDDDGGHR
jgi:hypothetical protein